MGEKLVDWNIEAFDLLTDAFFAIWAVDIFRFCGSSESPQKVLSNAYSFKRIVRFVPDWVPGLPYKYAYLLSVKGDTNAIFFRVIGRKSTYLTTKIRYQAYRRALELYVSIQPSQWDLIDRESNRNWESLIIVFFMMCWKSLETKKMYKMVWQSCSLVSMTCTYLRQE
jgi:hypothetical protein